MHRIIIGLLLSVIVFCEPAQASFKYSFEGSLNAKQKQLNLDVFRGEKKVVSVKANQGAEEKYHVVCSVEHLKTPRYEISSQLETTFQLKTDEETLQSFIEGKIWSKYSLVDFKPVRDLVGYYTIRDRKMTITSLNFGGIHSKGTLEISKPFNLDMEFQLNSVDMKEFLKFWSSKMEKYDSAGYVSGKIEAQGTPDRLFLKGDLDSTDGFIDKLYFENIHLSAEGVYPNIQVAQSTISEVDGMTFSLDGMIDLKDTKNFKRQIKDLKVSPIVSQTGKETEWTIRRHRSEEGEGVTEIKYLLRDSDEVRPGDEDDKGMLQIERKMEF